MKSRKSKILMRAVAFILIGAMVFTGVLFGISMFGTDPNTYAGQLMLREGEDGTDPGGTGGGTSTDPGTGSGTDPGTGTGTDPGTGSGGSGTGTGSGGSGTGTDSGSGTGTGTGTDSGSGSGTGTGTDSGSGTGTGSGSGSGTGTGSGSGSSGTDKPKDSGKTEVIPDPPKSTDKTEFTFNVSAKTDLTVGERIAITYTMSNEPKGTTVHWESSNETVAVVDSSGQLLAIKAGIAEVKATAGELTRSLVFNVTDILPTSIRIVCESFGAEEVLKKSHTIKNGEKLELSLEIKPEGAKLVTDPVWEVSDEKIAKISSDGVLKGKKAGDVTVTVTLGELTDTMAFNVSKKSAPIKIILILIFVLLILAAAAFVYLYLRKRKKSKEEEARQARMAQKKKRPADRKNNPAGRMTPADTTQDKNYRDEFENRPRFEDRRTRIYDVPPEAEPPKSQQPQHSGENGVDNLPDRPFSLDDIE